MLKVCHGNGEWNQHIVSIIQYQSKSSYTNFWINAWNWGCGHYSFNSRLNASKIENPKILSLQALIIENKSF